MPPSQLPRPLLSLTTQAPEAQSPSAKQLAPRSPVEHEPLFAPGGIKQRWLLAHAASLSHRPSDSQKKAVTAAEGPTAQKVAQEIAVTQP